MPLGSSRGARSSKHLRQAHSKFLSLGMARWPHLPQTKRPPEKAAIGLNSSPEVQYGHRTTVVVTAIFTTHTCFAEKFRHRGFYPQTITPT